MIGVRKSRSPWVAEFRTLKTPGQPFGKRYRVALADDMKRSTLTSLVYGSTELQGCDRSVSGPVVVEWNDDALPIMVAPRGSMDSWRRLPALRN
jgi:hypothetical protein